MAFHYDAVTIIWTYYNERQGADANPSAAALEAWDAELFAQWDQLATREMAAQAVAARHASTAVGLCTLAPGAAPVERARIAVAYLKNALAAAPPEAPRRRTTAGRSNKKRQPSRTRTPAARRRTPR